MRTHSLLDAAKVFVIPAKAGIRDVGGSGFPLSRE
jgi:hypothetical protein